MVEQAIGKGIEYENAVVLGFGILIETWLEKDENPSQLHRYQIT